MADFFDFKGVRSTSLGVRVMEFPPLMLPEERVEFKPALGRSGSLTILDGEGVYEDILLQISTFIENLTQLNNISTWLRGSGVLVLGNDPTRYYKARLVNQIDIRRIVRGELHRAFSMIFRCQPYRYHNDTIPAWSATAAYAMRDPVIEAGVVYYALLPNTNNKPPNATYWADTPVYLWGHTITNPGNEKSQPLYTVTGSGTIALSIGSKTIDITGLSGSVAIDVELGVAYQPGSDPLIPLTSIIGREYWPFTIAPGANLISWTGTISQLKIKPRWRDV